MPGPPQPRGACRAPARARPSAPPWPLATRARSPRLAENDGISLSTKNEVSVTNNEKMRLVSKNEVSVEPDLKIYFSQK